MEDQTGPAPSAPSTPRGRVAEDDARLRALRWMDGWVDPLLMFLAFCSIPLLIVQTGDPPADDQRFVSAGNWLIWGAFAVNFVVRLALSRDRRAELRGLSWDLVLLIGQPLIAAGPRKAEAGLALVRLVPVLSRALRRGLLLRRTGHHLRHHPLRVVAFVVPFVWLLSASVEWRLEQEGTITSVSDALWWSSATLTTVGYGDVSPKTLTGRTVAVLTMLVGIGMFSIVTAKLAELLFLQRLRPSRHDVVGEDFTLVLGWSLKVFTIVDELVAANRSRLHAAVVVLADHDSTEMFDALDAQVPALASSGTEVICRSGRPSDPAALARCRPDLARGIVIIDDTAEDASVVRALLALLHGAHPPRSGVPVVCEIDDPATAAALELTYDQAISVVNPVEFIARTTAQAALSAGVARTYDELLGFRGSELYVLPVPGTVGHRVDEITNGFSTCCVAGVRFPDGTVDLAPPPDLVVGDGDHLVVLAADDSLISFQGPTPLPAGAGGGTPRHLDPVHVIVFGWNGVAPVIIDQLDDLVPPGSRVTVAVDPDDAEAARGCVDHPPRHCQLVVRDAVGAAYAELVEALADQGCDHAIVLCDARERSVAEADARALVTTLLVRQALHARGSEATVVTQLLDERDTELIPPEAAGDFIVSDRLVGLLLAQLVEQAEVDAVFADLLDTEGAEIYCKPAAWYAPAGGAVTFAELAAAAARRGEAALGWRIVADSHDPAAHFGVTLNPTKATSITFAPDDQLVVLADEPG
ncbi:MAG: ion channel [Acidimicrobiales bacterium]